MIRRACHARSVHGESRKQSGRMRRLRGQVCSFAPANCTNKGTFEQRSNFTGYRRDARAWRGRGSVPVRGHEHETKRNDVGESMRGGKAQDSLATGKRACPAPGRAMCAVTPRSSPRPRRDHSSRRRLGLATMLARLARETPTHRWLVAASAPELMWGGKWSDNYGGPDCSHPRSGAGTFVRPSPSSSSSSSSSSSGEEEGSTAHIRNAGEKRSRRSSIGLFRFTASCILLWSIIVT